MALVTHRFFFFVKICLKSLFDRFVCAALNAHLANVENVSFQRRNHQIRGGGQPIQLGEVGPKGAQVGPRR